MTLDGEAEYLVRVIVSPPPEQPPIPDQLIDVVEVTTHKLIKARRESLRRLEYLDHGGGI